MVQPINGHILIEPLKHESFMASHKETFEEIGIVLALPTVHGSDTTMFSGIQIGDKVFFDSWLAAKYPNGINGDFYWLVKGVDVRAIEHGN